MTHTAARLAALERQVRTDHSVTVWHQAMTGEDHYTSDKYPGPVLTLAQIEARPEPTNGLRILVQYVDASPATRQPGERF